MKKALCLGVFVVNFLAKLGSGAVFCPKVSFRQNDRTQSSEERYAKERGQMVTLKRHAVQKLHFGWRKSHAR